VLSLAVPETLFMLSLNRTDRIRLLAAPTEVIHLVAKAVHQVRGHYLMVAKAVHQVRGH
jgi:hypothetical protein